MMLVRYEDFGVDFDDDDGMHNFSKGALRVRLFVVCDNLYCCQRFFLCFLFCLDPLFLKVHGFKSNSRAEEQGYVKINDEILSINSVEVEGQVS